MSTLITGGTSQNGLLIAKRLQEMGRDAVFATRSPQKVPSGFRYSKFDWTDATTFENAFEEHKDIENVYVLPPPAPQAVGSVKAFIDLAIKNGVKKFVLLSESCTPVGGPMPSGLVHEYLRQIGVEFVALRPTWFIENIFNFHGHTIRLQGEIISVIPDGKIPFVSVQDVADAAVEFIMGENSAQERFIVGPQSYSYDEVCDILKEYVGKPVKHRVITQEEQEAAYKGFGAPEDYVKALVEAEVKANDGGEAVLFQHENVYVGKHSLASVLEARRDFWKQ